ncbi:ceramide glucosyltransferase [Lichenibacterium ramalinae]|uniref:Ceramide glucosyltransferase n=1 Tax=Lichenibacterium ramalinae TaxID=2316527 RepID=A0A4V1RI60_9HYPH|nr:ceramide glucosyltransferase [Lichenibacterium ramalinae]RYB02443.1 ceramide glucosyltransferase [Lichenibacterium ramalinae]
MTVAECAAGFSVLMTGAQLFSTGVAAYRCRKIPEAFPVPHDAPPVSLMRPVCGMDNFEEETLGSSFRLDYPHYELIFCCEEADDPVLPLIRRLIAAHPHVQSRILVGRDDISANPKLNNCVKGWHGAAHDWIIMADSNVLMPPDYIQRLLKRYRPDTGLVCSTPIGSRPQSFWAEVECGFLNTLQARWQYAAEAIGFGFAQGKSMLWHRPVLDGHGSIEALGAEIAEDAAATKLVRRQGLKVGLADNPFEQPLGRRTFAEVWGRQLRWARLRRVTFLPFFLLEVFVGCLFPSLAAAFAAAAYGYDPVLAGLAVAAVWMAAEAVLAWSAGWRLTWASPFIWLLRDCLLPFLFTTALLTDDFVWRGNSMTVKEEEAKVG